MITLTADEHLLMAYEKLNTRIKELQIEPTDEERGVLEAIQLFYKRREEKKDV